jgi:hypothetical protein
MKYTTLIPEVVHDREKNRGETEELALPPSGLPWTTHCAELPAMPILNFVVLELKTNVTSTEHAAMRQDCFVSLASRGNYP